MWWRLSISIVNSCDHGLQTTNHDHKKSWINFLMILGHMCKTPLEEIANNLLPQRLCIKQKSHLKEKRPIESSVTLFYFYYYSFMVLKWHTGKLCTYFKMDSYDIVLMTLLSWVTRLGGTGSISFNLLLEIYLMDACQ